MSEQGQLDSDKLPWLEPYREPVAPRPRLREVRPASTPTATPRRRAIGSTVGASIGLVAAAALALGGYWYGRQSATGEDGAGSAIVTPLPPVGAERPVLTYPSIEDSGPAATPVAVADAPPPVRVEAAPVVREPVPIQARPERVVRRVERSAPPPPPVAAPPPPKPRVAASAKPSPVVVPRPRARLAALPPVKPIGKAGTNLLLGYYASPRYADLARARVIKRYPYLSGLPVQVAPVPLGQGRGSMYALRLVARSKSDARGLCKNLKGIGYGCTVQ